MIYFIFGQDSFRAKRKLEEIVGGYKGVHKSGLNLIYFDAGGSQFDDFYNNFKITPMFAEKKLVVLKNVFLNAKFQDDFLENIENLNGLKDIVVIFEDSAPDQRTKFFKVLKKLAKCQEFSALTPALAKKWAADEFKKNKTEITFGALDLLISYVRNDTWKLFNEIKKLSDYKAGAQIKEDDIKMQIKPNIENDIFKTIDALASGDKKQALFLMHKHIEDGDNALYILTMILYQFRNLLVIKDLQEQKNPYNVIAKKSGLHPFVVQKSFYLCNRFTIDKLKKIYHRIFQTDIDIKTGKVDPETALDLLLSEI